MGVQGARPVSKTHHLISGTHTRCECEQTREADVNRLASLMQPAQIHARAAACGLESLTTRRMLGSPRACVSCPGLLLTFKAETCACMNPCGRA